MYFSIFTIKINVDTISLPLSPVISFNLRNIYDYLPTNYQTYIKNFTIETYDGFSDQTKIILRAFWNTQKINGFTGQKVK